jgi:hypothetical protein
MCRHEPQNVMAGIPSEGQAGTAARIDQTRLTWLWIVAAKGRSHGAQQILQAFDRFGLPLRETLGVRFL